MCFEDGEAMFWAKMLSGCQLQLQLRGSIFACVVPMAPLVKHCAEKCEVSGSIPAKRKKKILLRNFLSLFEKFPSVVRSSFVIRFNRWLG
jgi:hypothetical protein